MRPVSSGSRKASSALRGNSGIRCRKLSVCFFGARSLLPCPWCGPRMRLQLIQKIYRLVLLRPSETFATPQEALRSAGLGGLQVESLSHFALPLIAVVVQKDGLPHVEACNFLLEKGLRSRGITGDTARSYGEALCDWLNFLRLRRCKPSDATEESLGLYRLHLRAPGPSGRALQASTANHRLTVAAEFQRWGQRTQSVTSQLGSFLAESRDAGGSNRFALRRRRSLGSYLAPVDKRLPKILTQEEIVRLFLVAPRPFDLMFRWAIVTGMRRVEVCNLRMGQLPSTEALSRQEGGLMMLDVRRKGGRLQSVAVPSRLLEQTIWYVDTERPNAARTRPPKEALVFIGPSGRGISRQRLSRAFRKCADAIGSTAIR